MEFYPVVQMNKLNVYFIYKKKKRKEKKLLKLFEFRKVDHLQLHRIQVLQLYNKIIL